MMIGLILMFGTSCTPKDPALDSGQGDGGSTTGDGGDITQTTTWWTDTGTEETTDTGTSADGGTTEPTGPTVESVQVWPSSMVVGPAATWSMRLVASWDDGVVADATASWSSLDPAVASVDTSGLVTSIAAGSTSITGCVDSVCAEVPVEVRDDGLVTVRVLARESGTPLNGARLQLGQDGEEYLTDSKGVASLPVTEEGAQTVSVWARERVPVTVEGVVQRQITVTLRDKAELSVGASTIEGPVDLEGVPRGGAGDLKMGVAAPSLTSGPLLLLPSQLVATDHTVSLYGVEAEVPRNVYIRDVVEEWAVPAQEGTTAIWTLAAPLPISEVTSSLAGVTDVIGLMLEDLDRLVWGWHEGVEVAAGETGSASLAPATELTASLEVEAGALPVGFRGDEEILVMLGDLLDAGGFLPVGVGVGRGLVEVSYAEVSIPGSTGRAVAAAAQVGGIGSGKGNGLCASWVSLTEGSVLLPSLQQAPAVHLFDPTSREYTVETDPRSRLVYISIQGGEEGKYREVLLDGGRVEGVLPHLGEAFGYGATTWDLLGLELATGTVHDHHRDGVFDLGALAMGSWTSASLEVDP